MDDWSPTTRHRFDTEADWLSVFNSLSFDPHTMSFDIIGRMEGRDDFHVNARWCIPMPDAFIGSEVIPASPQRVFAGEPVPVGDLVYVADAIPLNTDDGSVLDGG